MSSRRSRDSELSLGANGSSIVLAIHKEHIERIFAGHKRFELRKNLPPGPIRRVYLYETGGVGIVGCFDVKSVIRSAPQTLWRRVGAKATTRDRFFTYYGSRPLGVALEIANPVRFVKPIAMAEARLDYPTLRAPQSFLLLRPSSALFARFERTRAEALRRVDLRVHFRRVRKAEERSLRTLIDKYVGPHYDGIDDSFADSLLRVARAGKDPAGFFTDRKEVLAVIDGKRRLLGFTVLTYKSGGAVKTGPTLLFEKYQDMGFGQATRAAIEQRVRMNGARKLYCTAPDRNFRVVRYLLESGMRIEAHLRRHYATTHDELVFGKLLVSEPTRGSQVPATSRRGVVVDPSALNGGSLARDFRELFEATYHPLSMERARAITSTGRGKRGRMAYKPKRLVCLADRGSLLACVTLLPKRGGAVKGVLLTSTNSIESLHALVEASIGESIAQDFRKLYFLQPVTDYLGVDLLKSMDFQIEGVLRAPYVPGLDVLVLARLF